MINAYQFGPDWFIGDFENDTGPVASIHHFPSRDEEFANRLADCYNACQGVEHPAELIAILRDYIHYDSMDGKIERRPLRQQIKHLLKPNAI